MASSARTSASSAACSTARGRRVLGPAAVGDVEQVDRQAAGTRPRPHLEPAPVGVGVGGLEGDRFAGRDSGAVAGLEDAPGHAGERRPQRRPDDLGPRAAQQVLGGRVDVAEHPLLVQPAERGGHRLQEGAPARRRPHGGGSGPAAAQRPAGAARPPCSRSGTADRPPWSPSRAPQQPGGPPVGAAPAGAAAPPRHRRFCRSRLPLPRRTCVRSRRGETGGDHPAVRYLSRAGGCGRVGGMTRDGAVAPSGDAPPPGDLLVQAVEGMDRPLFVARRGLAVPVHQPGRRDRARPHGRVARRSRRSGTSSPRRSAVPFEALYREVRETGRSGSTEAWFAAAREVVPRRRLPDRCRTGGHLRRRDAAAPHRGRACGRRRGARGRRRGSRPCRRRGRDGGPSPDAARRHQPGDDVDPGHRRGRGPLRAPRRPAAGRLVPGQRHRPRRDAARRRPGAQRSVDGRGDAPLRRRAGGLQPGRRPGADGAAEPASR